MGFKQLLDTLRLSAKEAIVDGEKDSLDALKKYLHIERPVEHDLSAMITAAASSPQPALILLLGNVGDGKSHLLARMWEKHPELLAGFKITNDATESNYKDRTYLQILAEVFQPYSDDRLGDPANLAKTIVAINLGTLANFLGECGEGFDQFRKYVADHHLVEEKKQAAATILHPQFRALNLADYHIYALSAGGARSEVLLDIIKKITAPTADNPFHLAYTETYQDHPAASACPVKYNYDLMAKPEVQAALNALLVKSILTDKLIISVRLLMNLVYDLIVPPELAVKTDEEIRAAVSAPAYKNMFYTNTLPVLLFESHTTSAIFRSFQRLDPVSCDNEALDETIVKLAATTDPGYFFTRYGLLPFKDPLLELLPELTVRQRVALFLRLCLIHNQLGISKDGIFKTFVDDLYNFNADRKSALQLLYRKVAHAIYQWNGTTAPGSNTINLDIGRQQSVYTISRSLSLEFSPPAVPAPQAAPLNRFSDTLKVGFKVKADQEEPFVLHIDYLLYQLIDRIQKGYRPNRIDKDIHVRFSRFVNELIRYESATRELTIRKFDGETKKQFTLSYSAGFDSFQFIEA